MGSSHGCLKLVGLGCLGLIVLVVLGVGIPAFIAWHSLGDRQVAQREFSPAGGAPAAGSTADSASVAEASVSAAPAGTTPATPGRVILDLAQGEFAIRPAAAGDGVSVDAKYDQSAAELVDEFEVLPDSTWVYKVRYRQKTRGLTGIMRALMGGNRGAYVHVNIPPDIPIALEVHTTQGGCEADLSGLWLTDLQVQTVQGGLELDVDEPLREPIERLSIKTTMGGVEADGLANVAPRTLVVETMMGGAELDLRGAWLRDTDIHLSVTMGGISVVLPNGVDVRGLAAGGARLETANPEVPLPILRFSVSESMGEVEVIRR